MRRRVIFWNGHVLFLVLRWNGLWAALGLSAQGRGRSHALLLDKFLDQDRNVSTKACDKVYTYRIEQNKSLVEHL